MVIALTPMLLDTVASQTHSLVSGTGGGLTLQFLTSS